MKVGVPQPTSQPFRSLSSSRFRNRVTRISAAHRLYAATYRTRAAAINSLVPATILACSTSPQLLDACNASAAYMYLCSVFDISVAQTRYRESPQPMQPILLRSSNSLHLETRNLIASGPQPTWSDSATTKFRRLPEVSSQVRNLAS